MIKRILFIYPPVTRPADFSATAVRVSSFLPLGIAYIAAVLEQAGGYEIEILDALISGDMDEGTPLSGGASIRYGLTDEAISEKIREFNPDVVAVPCLFSAMQADALQVCRLAKQLRSGITTVLGGAHAGAVAREIIDNSPEVDFVIIGEAEETFVKLLRVLSGKGALSSLNNGIVFRKNGNTVCIAKTSYIQDLDSLPFPARHLFDMQKYLDNAKSHGYYRAAPYTQMITSRGCPCKCTFCALGSHWGSRQRLRSARNVLDEIEHLITAYGIKEIHFEDDNVIADKRRANELFDGMIERGFNIKWHVPSGIAVYTLNEEILGKMKASGCYSVTMAIESGNQEVVAKLMNKPVKLKLVPGLVKKIREAGLDVRGFFIIGYPDETRQTIQQTIDFAREIELDWSYFSIASPLPNTDMYRLCIKKGYIKEGDFDPLRSFHRSIIHTPEFDPEYLYQVREEAIIDTCFRNNPNLHKYNIDKAIADFSDVVERYPHFDFANFYLGEAYRKKGDQAKALQSYKNTLAANPAHELARTRLGELEEHETEQ